MQANKFTPVNFSEHLSALLKDRGITQKQFAQELEVSPATVHKWLHGTMPLGGALTRLSMYFGLSGDYLLYPQKHKASLKEYAAEMNAAATPEAERRAEQSLETKTALQKESRVLRDQRDAALDKLAKLKKLLQQALSEI
jgi:transcriptional regulator with XRE-family HTH domain